MKKQFGIIISLFITVAFLSCKKNSQETNAEGQIVVHGNITLTVHAKHHSWGVGNIGVHLAKNATAWPGTDTTKYQMHTQTNLDGDAVFENLFTGTYYIYAQGFDSFFGANVIGYSPLEINSGEPNNQVETTLYVSE